MKLIRSHFESISVPGWQRPGRVRLALITDLHNNMYPGLLNLLEEAAPDFVCIAGDMVNRPTRLMPPHFTRGYGCLSKLAARYPVYYALGNHESSWRRHPVHEASFRQYRRALEKKGVCFLDNKRIDLGDNENPLTLSGLTLGKEQFTHHLKNRRPPESLEIQDLLGEPRPFQVLLAHHPFYFDAYAAWGADVVLSGHLHGGQFRLPGIGGLVASGPQLFPPYTKGHFRKEGSHMLVSPGIGTHTIPFRIFNPREVWFLDLVKE